MDDSTNSLLFSLVQYFALAPGWIFEFSAFVLRGLNFTEFKKRKQAKFGLFSIARYKGWSRMNEHSFIPYNLLKYLYKVSWFYLYGFNIYEVLFISFLFLIYLYFSFLFLFFLILYLFFIFLYISIHLHR